MKKEINDVREKKKRKIRAGVLIGAGILILLYMGISVYFMNHFYVGTLINDDNYGGRSPKYVHDEILEQIETYELRIKGRDDTEDIIQGKEIELVYQSDETLTEIMKEQNGWLWFMGLFQKHSYEFAKVANYNDAMLMEKIENLRLLQSENMKPPKNAYICANDTKDGYEIVEEVPGSTLDVERTKNAIKETIGRIEEELNLEEADCYIKPKVTKESKSLVKDYEALNRCLGVTITYDFEIARETVNKEQIKDWMTYDSKGIHFDEEKVREYVNSIARKYDTYGRNRKFRTMDGAILELLSGGYGWRVDRAAETEQLIKDIKAGKDLTREMIYISKGYVRKDNGEGGVDDIGDTYVEINLGAQHLYVVQEGTVVEESDFVSGKLSNGNGTPAGVFGITYKERDATLTGASYESHVSYWMPFNGNIGMHDATWRREFGKNIYLTNGSHGCINLPVEKAEIIYGLVEKGMPVVCYY